jgi:glycosyltransferase involved in cell wall biosynthesis
MSTQPDVSVVIHFLNAGRYLAEALRSVERQTDESWELILVDGGSSDESAGIAAAYAQARPERIRYLRQPGTTTLGIFSSRLWGAREARAPLLAHLDADDEWHPQFLERHRRLHRMCFGGRPGLVYCPMVYWWDEAARAFDAYVQPIPAPGVHEPPSLVLPFVDDGYARSPGNSAVMASKEIILAASELAGIADEGSVEDQFLWSLAGLRYPICVNPEPLARYRQWSGSTCSRSVENGTINERRLFHLRWLERYLRESYRGPEQMEMFERIRSEVG